MKKINNYAMAIFLMVFVGFVGCQKSETTNFEQIVETQNNFNQKVSVVDNMLYFETIADYENTMDYLANLGDENFEKWENDISFNSMRRVLDEESREEIGIDDDLFATVLNENGLIHIGEHIFQIDLLNEKVLVIKSSEYDSSNGSMLNAFNTKGDIETFSTNDEVLEIIKGNAVKNNGKGACTQWTKGYYTTNTNYGWVKRKVAYKRVGIYFWIYAKIKQEYAYPRCHIELKTYNYDGVNFYVKNKRRYDCDHKVVINRSARGGGNSEYHWRPYRSTRSLKQYKWHVEFYYYDNVNAWNPKLKINCGTQCN